MLLRNLKLIAIATRLACCVRSLGFIISTLVDSDHDVGDIITRRSLFVSMGVFSSGWNTFARTNLRLDTFAEYICSDKYAGMFGLEHICRDKYVRTFGM